MSKFDAVLKSRRKPDAESPAPTHEPVAAVEERRGPGRPRTGKRSNPDFEPVTAYIRRDTHKQVKIALLQQEQPQEFSELVEMLLSNWLQSKT